MPGVRVEDEPRSRDPRGQEVVVGDRIEPVERAVGHERRRGDRRCPAAERVGAVEPLQGSLRLGAHDRRGGGRGGRVAREIDRERTGCQSLIGRIEVGARRLCVAVGERAHRLLRWEHHSGAGRERRRQYQPPDLGGVLDGQSLRDHAAHRPAEDVGPPQAERVDQRARLARHSVDRQRCGQRLRVADAGVVEDDDRVAARERVDEARVPDLHRPCVAHDQDQRRTAPELAVADHAELRLDRVGGDRGHRRRPSLALCPSRRRGTARAQYRRRPHGDEPPGGPAAAHHQRIVVRAGSTFPRSARRRPATRGPARRAPRPPHPRAPACPP